MWHLRRLAGPGCRMVRGVHGREEVAYRQRRCQSAVYSLCDALGCGRWRSRARGQRGLGRLIRVYLNGCCKTITAAIDRLDKALHAPVIAEDLSHCPERTLQRRIADELVGPYLLAQLLLRDHTVAMFEEVGEHVPHFGSESYELTSTVENMQAGVQFTVTKSVDHLAPFLNSPEVSRGLAHRRVPCRPIQRSQETYAILTAVLMVLYLLGTP